jgi:uncharacterized protein
MTDRQWAMVLHFSILLGFFVPIAGLIAPILIWQVKKTEIPEIDAHGKVVLNWIISVLIYGCVCLVLTLILIGKLLLFILFALCVAFPIIGGIKANNGKIWKYPMSIEFWK